MNHTIDELGNLTGEDLHKSLLHLLNKGKLDSNICESVLLRSCEKGDISTVVFVLNSNGIKEKICSLAYETGLTKACEFGHLSIVKYFLDSDKYQHYFNTAAYENSFLTSCEFGEIEIAKYFLTSERLKNIIDIHMQNDQAMYHALANNHTDIIKFFIFDQDISINKTINRLLTSSNLNEKVLGWLEMRELNKNLNSELIPARQDKNKAKI